MWLNELKKALILQDFDSLEKLIELMPAFDSLQEIKEASYLLDHAKTLLETEKSATLHSLQQLKDTINFLKATENTPSSSINLKL